VIECDIPARGHLQLLHLVLDVNGTLALDGRLLEGAAERLAALKEKLTVHLITADTHGRQAEIDRLLGLQAVRLQGGQEAEQKAAYVRALGAANVVAIGQGVNDKGMLEAAALGICVLSPEGTAVAALLAADLLVPTILDALDLLEHPLRLRATLRE